MRRAWATISLALALAIACGKPQEPTVPPLTIATADASSPEAIADAAPVAIDLPLFEALREVGDAGALLPLAGGAQNVVVLVDFVPLRTHESRAHFEAFLASAGTFAGYPLDVLHDVDWLLLYGPSLVHTDRDVILARSALDDAALDRAIDRLTLADAGDQGPYDAGVRGVKAARVSADNASRVVMRPQSKLIVIAPPEHAKAAARAFAGKTPGPLRANELLRVVLREPSKQISIRGVRIDEKIHEARLRVVLERDGGANVDLALDAEDAASANAARDALADLLRQQNTVVVRSATHGLLDKAELRVEDRTVALHIHATFEQVDAIASLLDAATRR